VVTDSGLVRIGELVSRAVAGDSFAVYTNDVTSETEPAERILATSPTRYMVTGTNEIVELRFSDGSRLRCTPNHRVWTTEGWVRAEHLTEDHKIVRSFHHADRSAASVSLSSAARRVAASAAELALPEKWDDDLAHFVGWLVGDGCLTSRGIAAVYGTKGDQEDVPSEYLSLDNSSCNLSSLNLMKFRREDGTFDAQLFVKVVELVTTSMDISICFADFRPRRSARPPSTTASWASATATSARC
jgi:ribonucleoside-diphosphate reductase alpha chain